MSFKTICNAALLLQILLFATATNAQTLAFAINGTLISETIDIIASDGKSRTLRFYNIAGQQVFTAQIQGSQRLNISALVSGLYIISTEKGEIARFVKE